MKAYKYVIIGGGVAGGSAVDAIRQIDKEGRLALVTQEVHRPYQRPPLSKGFMTGKKELKSVYLHQEEEYARQHVDLLLGLRITGLDPVGRSLSGEGGFALNYEKLLLATGGQARRLQIPGNNLAGVFTLRTIEDSECIRSAAGNGRRALVLGGSFIGCEVAASLTKLGMAVTMAFPEGRLLERIVPPDMGDFLHRFYQEHGVRLLPKTTARRLEGTAAVQRAVLSNKQNLDVDLVVMGVGIDLDTSLAVQAGLQVRLEDEAILVDETLRTSNAHIYAAGDIAAWPSDTFGQRLRVEHWDVARRQGERAGRNMAGESHAYTALPYFFSDLFSLSFEAWGNFSNWNRTLLRGSLEEKSFSCYYFADNRLVGALAADRPKCERTAIPSLVEARLPYDLLADSLRDENFDLSELAGEKPA
ncbi:MAG: NAD(P)/FAD-dependent oxidoreductase [Chloroflexota bacterium]